MFEVVGRDRRIFIKGAGTSPPGVSNCSCNLHGYRESRHDIQVG